VSGQCPSRTTAPCSSSSLLINLQRSLTTGEPNEMCSVRLWGIKLPWISNIRLQCGMTYALCSQCFICDSVLKKLPYLYLFSSSDLILSLTGIIMNMIRSGSSGLYGWYFLPYNFREKNIRMIIESGYPNVGGFKYWCSMLIRIDDKGMMEANE
jgi:hypothetical protein